MKMLLNSFHYVFIIVSLAEGVFATVQNETTTMQMSTETYMTTTIEPTTKTPTGDVTEIVTTFEEDVENTTKSVGEGTDEMITSTYDVTTQMTTKMVETPKYTPTKCYECSFEAGTDEEDTCAAEQMDKSKTTDCNGNCWITAFYGESDMFINVTRSCEPDKCTDMNQGGFHCKQVVIMDDTKTMCTHCCSSDNCNGMSDASNTRYNGFMLTATIIAYGIFYNKIL